MMNYQVHKKGEISMKAKQIFKEDIFTKNPIYVLMLGMCPSLAITTSIDNALGMTLAVTLVLILTSVSELITTGL